MLANIWLEKTKKVMDEIADTQTENIKTAAEIMTDLTAAGRWVDTFGCGHGTLPIEEMYPRIGGLACFHPMIEIPLSFFTYLIGEMGASQFVFLKKVEGYSKKIMKSYSFDPRDTMWFIVIPELTPSISAFPLKHAGSA